ncbi:MAG: hypothetical protein UED73_06705 [Acutalibacteraceae bacterium]|nr:hypothetical protein [Acutalibacteraceae bacterium]
MLKITVQDSKTFLRPQLQLFAEPASKEDPDKNPNNQIPPPADPPGGGTEPNLPKTQEELDALINTRLKRAEKDWLKKQKPAQQPPAAPPATPPAEGVPPAEDNSASLQREIVETRAQLAAYKEGVKPEAVEDAVLLAMHDVEKSGDELDEDAVAEALKEVLKRHPEWKKQDDQKNNSGGFRVGAGGNKNHPKTDDDALAAIFGNNLK